MAMSQTRCSLCEAVGISGTCPHGNAMDPEDTGTKEIQKIFQDEFPEADVVLPAPAPGPAEPTTWAQERPSWCPHKDCLFRRRAMDAICGGELAVAQPHAPGETPVNTHRFCMNLDQSPAVKRADIIDLQVNAADLDWFRWIFDSIDGRETSHMNRRTQRGAGPEPSKS